MSGLEGPRVSVTLYRRIVVHPGGVEPPLRASEAQVRRPAASATWWTRRGSNPPVPACKAGVAPLRPRARELVDRPRVELGTSCLRGRRSPRLSYATRCRWTTPPDSNRAGWGCNPAPHPSWPGVVTVVCEVGVLATPRSCPWCARCPATRRPPPEGSERDSNPRLRVSVRDGPTAPRGLGTGGESRTPIPGVALRSPAGWTTPVVVLPARVELTTPAFVALAPRPEVGAIHWCGRPDSNRCPEVGNLGS